MTQRSDIMENSFLKALPMDASLYVSLIGMPEPGHKHNDHGRLRSAREILRTSMCSKEELVRKLRTFKFREHTFIDGRIGYYDYGTIRWIEV